MVSEYVTNPTLILPCISTFVSHGEDNTPKANLILNQIKMVVDGHIEAPVRSKD